MVMSLSFIINKSQYPKLCLAFQDLRSYVLLVIFASQSEQRKTVLCLSLFFMINQIFVICSLIIFHRLMQLCFSRVVLDSETLVSDSWISVPDYIKQPLIKTLNKAYQNSTTQTQDSKIIK